MKAVVIRVNRPIASRTPPISSGSTALIPSMLSRESAWGPGHIGKSEQLRRAVLQEQQRGHDAQDVLRIRGAQLASRSI